MCGQLGVVGDTGRGVYLIIRSIVQDAGDTVVQVSWLELRWAALWAVRRLGAPQRLAVARCSWRGGGVFTCARSCAALRQDPFSQTLWVPPSTTHKSSGSNGWEVLARF